MLVVTRKRPVLELEWHHCVQEKNLEGQAWETLMAFCLPNWESIDLWNKTSFCFACGVSFLCHDASSSQRKYSSCLEFHNPSLASPSSSPCPELCWGSESWGWRVLSGSDRREIPSTRSSTPSRISLAHNWKEQAEPHAAQWKPNHRKKHH